MVEKRDAWFMTLSGGQKQRLFIALALIHDPELVFLDELTTGLDPQARRAIWDLVRGIRERGKTVFLTTHLMEEAERLCDRVAVIDHGRIVDVGTPAELVRRHCPERAVMVDDRRDDGGERSSAPFPTSRPSVAQRRIGDGARPRDDLVTNVIRCIAEHAARGRGLPNGDADPGRRVPAPDRPFDSGADADAQRAVEADLAGAEDLPARAARA